MNELLFYHKLCRSYNCLSCSLGITYKPGCSSSSRYKKKEKKEYDITSLEKLIKDNDFEIYIGKNLSVSQIINYLLKNKNTSENQELLNKLAKQMNIIKESLLKTVFKKKN